MFQFDHFLQTLQTMEALEYVYLQRCLKQKKKKTYKKRRAQEHLDTMSEDEFIINFRFTKDGVKKIAAALHSKLGYWYYYIQLCFFIRTGKIELSLNKFCNVGA